MHNSILNSLVQPIRTRQTLARSAGEEYGERPHLTRGAVRVRSTLPADLSAIVRDLREAARGIPLTFVLHGWDDPPTRAFHEALRPLLWPEDAVWLTPRPEATPPADSGGSVLLDLSRAVERRTYNNLVADLIFFCAVEASELASAAAWTGRTQLAVVPAGSLLEEPIRRLLLTQTLPL
jgi:hypothetical protein